MGSEQEHGHPCLYEEHGRPCLYIGTEAFQNISWNFVGRGQFEAASGTDLKCFSDPKSTALVILATHLERRRSQSHFRVLSFRVKKSRNARVFGARLRCGYSA